MDDITQMIDDLVDAYYRDAELIGTDEDEEVGDENNN